MSSGNIERLHKRSDERGTEILLDESGNARALRIGDNEIPFERVRIAIRRADDDVDLAEADVAHRIAVVQRGDDTFVAFLDPPDVREIRGQAEFSLTFDPTLPGGPGKDPDPWVVYRCTKGDSVRQKASSTNRTCPFDGTPLTRV